MHMHTQKVPKHAAMQNICHSLAACRVYPSLYTCVSVEEGGQVMHAICSCSALCSGTCTDLTRPPRLRASARVTRTSFHLERTGRSP